MLENLNLDSMNYSFAKLWSTESPLRSFQSLRHVGSWINMISYHDFNFYTRIGMNSFRLSSNRVGFPLKCVVVIEAK